MLPESRLGNEVIVRNQLSTEVSFPNSRFTNHNQIFTVRFELSVEIIYKNFVCCINFYTHLQELRG